MIMQSILQLFFLFRKNNKGSIEYVPERLTFQLEKMIRMFNIGIAKTCRTDDIKLGKFDKQALSDGHGKTP